MKSFCTREMAEYWIDIIRNERDAFRTFVSNPALFGRLDALPAKQRILDCGCGEGYVSRRLAGSGHEVTGIDLSEHMIEAAKSASCGSEKYLCGDLLGLKFPDGSFDAVVMNFVMELKSPEKAMREISRVLRDGGRFIFQTLHPFYFTSNVGSSDGRKEDGYFESKLYVEKFVVGGLESPVSSNRYRHPLCRYTRALHDNKFVILFLDEPQPTENAPPDHPIRQTLRDPWILLIDAQKQLAAHI